MNEPRAPSPSPSSAYFTMAAFIGIPVKLLHEAQGLTVTIEVKTGQLYRGALETVEDNMNVQLKQVIMTARDGQMTPMENVMLRGSSIRYFIIPDNLKHAPMLQPKEILKSSHAIGRAGKAPPRSIRGARGGSVSRGRRP